MIDTEINQMILDKIKEVNTPPYVRDFVLGILRHERSVYEEYEAGKHPRYSRVYNNLLNKAVREYKTQENEVE